MAKTPWMMTAIPLALMFGLTGCNGGDDEEGAPAAEESGQAPQSSQASVEAGSVERTPRDEASAAGDDDAADTAAGNGSAGDDQVQAGATGEGGAAGTGDTGQGGEAAADDTVVGESAGESAANDSWDNSEDDIDQVLKETERRFEEAEKEINEQFEQAQQQDVKEQQTIEIDASPDSSATGSN